MKKYLILPMIVLVLCACAGKETMETIADEWEIPAMAQPKRILLDVPGEAEACAVESDNGRLYMSEGYEISVQTMSAGDVDATLKTMTGFGKDELTVMQTVGNDVKKYEFVWTSAGEHGERLGHGIVLDDGNYHYCLSVLRDAQDKEIRQVIWDQVYQSFGLA